LGLWWPCDAACSGAAAPVHMCRISSHLRLVDAYKLFANPPVTG
jgi:hypothetical protein